MSPPFYSTVTVVYFHPRPYKSHITYPVSKSLTAFCGSSLSTMHQHIQMAVQPGRTCHELVCVLLQIGFVLFGNASHEPFGAGVLLSCKQPAQGFWENPERGVRQKERQTDRQK